MTGRSPHRGGIGLARPLGVSCLCGLVWAGPVPAQTGSLHLDAGAAHALPPAGAPGDEVSYLLAGLRLEPALRGAVRVFLSGYGGLAVQEEAGDWGSARLGIVARGPVAEDLMLGFTALGEGFAVGGESPYRALAVRGGPEVLRRFGRTSLRLHGGGGVGGSEVGSGPLQVASDLWSAGGGLELRHDGGQVAVAVGAEGYRAAREAEFLSAYLGLSGDAGPTSWRAEVRGWDTPTGGEFVATARLVVPLGGRVEAAVSGGRYGPDPLLESPAGTSAAVVLSWRVARFRAGPPPLYTFTDDGTGIRFELRRPGASRVVLLGEFNDWRPVPMTEESSGRWVVTQRLEPGVYRFGFQVDGEWYVPAEAPGVSDDEWGRPTAWLVVPEP